MLKSSFFFVAFEMKKNARLLAYSMGVDATITHNIAC